MLDIRGDYIVKCDHEDCNTENSFWGFTRSDVIKDLEQRGWKVIKDRTYCPEHANEKEEN